MSSLTRSLLRRRLVFAGTAGAIFWALFGGTVLGGQNPFGKRRGGGSVKYKTFKDPSNRFEIAYPEKDWRILPSAGSNLAVFARNDGPTVFVEHVALTEHLTPAELAVMPDMELERIKAQDRPTKDFKSDMFESKSGRGVLIKYFRIGQGPESILQFTIAVGGDLFRLNSVVPERLFAKYEPILMYMIQSFKAPA